MFIVADDAAPRMASLAMLWTGPVSSFKSSIAVQKNASMLCIEHFTQIDKVLIVQLVW